MLFVSRMGRMSVVAALAIMAASTVRADFTFTMNGQTITEDFNSFRGTGFAPMPASGQLDSNVYRAVLSSTDVGTFGGVHENGVFAMGTATGAVSTGGGYAFEISPGDFAVGVQPTGGIFTPGTFTIRGRNETAGPINFLQLSADGHFFNDQDRSSRWSFELSLGDESNYTPLFAINSNEAADPTPQWSTIPLGGLIPLGPGLPDNTDFFVRITGDDLGGSGSRDQFALNNLRMTVSAVPEPTSVLLLASLFCGRTVYRFGRRSGRRASIDG